MHEKVFKSGRKIMARSCSGDWGRRAWSLKAGNQEVVSWTLPVRAGEGLA